MAVVIEAVPSIPVWIMLLFGVIIFMVSYPALAPIALGAEPWEALGKTPEEWYFDTSMFWVDTGVLILGFIWGVFVKAPLIFLSAFIEEIVTPTGDPAQDLLNWLWQKARMGEAIIYAGSVTQTVFSSLFDVFTFSGNVSHTNIAEWFEKVLDLSDLSTPVIDPY